jgi:hypothetical protein
MIATLRIVDKDSEKLAYFVLLDLLLQSPVTRTDGFQQSMELGAVVQVLKMAEFVQHHIVLQFLREGYQAEVQIDVSQAAAAAPVAAVVLDENAFVLEAVLSGQGGQARGQFGLGLSPHTLHLGRYRRPAGFSSENVVKTREGV